MGVAGGDSGGVDDRNPDGRGRHAVAKERAHHVLRHRAQATSIHDPAVGLPASDARYDARALAPSAARDRPLRFIQHSNACACSKVPAE